MNESCQTKYSLLEDQYLIRNYLHQTLTQLGSNINRSYGSVHSRLKKLNLILPEDIKKERQLNGLKLGWENGVNTRFKKGGIPANKGKKVSNEQYEKMKHTFYQKGHLPHNTQYDGATRITFDGYTEIRISSRVWKLKHRLVWEEHNGAIPDDCIVKFKDGNKLNFEITNLEIITKHQHMLNNNIHQYPPELKQSIRSLQKLIRNIKKQQDEANKY